MIEIVRYTQDNRNQWNEFVSHSKNGTFMLNRNYMEYHADRFKDCSLLFFQNGRLIGLLPANVSENTLYSHQGLTYAGIISDRNMTQELMLHIFDELKAYAIQQGLSKIVYKCIPYIYHTIPAQEDLYALFRFDAKLYRRDPAFVVIPPKSSSTPKVIFEKSRLRKIRKAFQSGVVVRESDDLRAFMKIVEEMLVERHKVKPVHTYEEMRLLRDRFPDNIRLYAAYKGEEMLAGIIIYESPNVAHNQYSFNSKAGMKISAEDVVFDYLINTRYADKPYFDIGIPTENNGRYLNLGLTYYKESFGASPVAHDFYEISF